MEKHLLYNEFFIGNMAGMLLKCVPIGEIPPSGKRLYLSGGDAQTEYFTYFPGSGVRRFTNGEAVTTPREGMSRLFYTPSEGYILAVNRGSVSTGVINLPLVHFPVFFESGRQFDVQVQGTISAELTCTDAKALANSYLKDGMTDPLSRVNAALSAAAYRHIRSSLEQSLAERAPIAAFNVASYASTDAEPIFNEVQAQFKWLYVPWVNMNFEIVNANDLVSYSNEMFEESKEIRAKLRSTMLELATRSLITPEVSQLVQSYLNVAMISPDPQELIGIVKSFVEMGKNCSGQEMLLQMKKMGLIPAGTGGLLT